MAEVVATDSVSDRVIFAARGRLIGRSGSVDMDLLFVDGVVKAADGTPNKGGECRKPAEPGGSGSRRDRGWPRDTFISIQCLTAQEIHLGFTVREVRLQSLQLHFNAILFAKAALVCLRQVFQRRSGHFKFLIDLFEKFFCTWMPLPLQLGDRRPRFVPRRPGARSMSPLAVGRWPIYEFADPSHVPCPLELLKEPS